jgi:hypothetical protein
MTEPLADVDLDALVPRTKTAKLNGKLYKLPYDMPMELFMRLQDYEGRAAKGEDELVMLAEVQDELLKLFQVHSPTMKTLPPMGVQQLLLSLGAIYGGAVGEAPPPTPPKRPPKRKTPSKPQARARARRPTSR